MISRYASTYKLIKFVHLSALGIEDAKDSIYAQSKLKGEKEILSNFNKAVIVRPSIVYSVDDNFTTQLMTLMGLMPIFQFTISKQVYPYFLFRFNKFYN